MLARWFVISLAALLLTADAEAAERTIYRCAVDGVATFSDRPCGEAIVIHSLEAAASHAPVAERAVPAPVASARPHRSNEPKRVAGSKPSSIRANDRSMQARECARLDIQLRRLTARMRSGYNGAQGERLRELYRTQRARRRALDCN